MRLFIDPSSPDVIRLVFFSDNAMHERIVRARNRELLRVIADALEEDQYTLAHITGVVVLVGQGGFSSTRIASVIGNTFSYALHVPVVAVDRAHEPTVETIDALFSTPSSHHYIVPMYSSEPTIGTSHHS